jgi:hypothetical protein
MFDRTTASLGLAVTLALAAGCSPCPPVHHPALVVHVRNATTGTPVAGATVTATRGDGTTEALTDTTNSGIYSAPDVRGAVEVAVRKDAFRPSAQQVSVAAESGGCHDPTELTIDIHPEGSP